MQLGNYHSDSYFTRSGVSQGSVLGPTQFLIMVNDLPSVISSAQCLMFADDLKLFLGINCTKDCEALQRDIDSVVAWGARNHLEFNTAKCKTITFTRSRAPRTYNYKISGVPLERVTQIRDLGVTLDSCLTFNTHIANICKQSYMSLGFVMRQSSLFQSKSTIIALYFSFVRSILEYNSIIWDPHEVKYSVMIERVQRKFYRFLYKKLYGYYPYLYPSLFVSGALGLDTLALRRKCAILLHYYLLFNNKIENSYILSHCSLLAPNQYTRLRSRPLFALPQVRTCTAQYAPTSQAIALLNSLITHYPQVDIFFTKFDLFLKFCLYFLSFNFTFKL